MAKAYWISFYHSISDPAKLAAYATIAVPALIAGGGKTLARGTPAKAFEAGKMERTVVIEFESVEAALAVHDGEIYQTALKALGDGAIRDLRIVPGVD